MEYSLLENLYFDSRDAYSFNLKYLGKRRKKKKGRGFDFRL